MIIHKKYIKTNNKLKRKKIRRYVNTYNIQWTIKLSIWCERKIRVLENQIRKITIYYLFSSFYSCSFGFLFCAVFSTLSISQIKIRKEKHKFFIQFPFPLKFIRIICSSSDPDMTSFRLTKNILPKENNRYRIKLIWLSLRILLKCFIEFFLSTNTKMIDAIWVISLVK